MDTRWNCDLKWNIFWWFAYVFVCVCVYFFLRIYFDRAKLNRMISEIRGFCSGLLNFDAVTHKFSLGILMHRHTLHRLSPFVYKSWLNIWITYMYYSFCILVVFNLSLKSINMHELVMHNWLKPWNKPQDFRINSKSRWIKHAVVLFCLCNHLWSMDTSIQCKYSVRHQIILIVPMIGLQFSTFSVWM